jgi:hypothetical protein
LLQTNLILVSHLIVRDLQIHFPIANISVELKKKPAINPKIDRTNDVFQILRSPTLVLLVVGLATTSGGGANV